MEFHFNTFFGIKEIDTGMVFFIPFIGLILSAIIIALIGGIFRKLHFNMYIFHVLLYTIMFTFVIGSLTMLILLLITDRNGVKLAYCWLSFFLGMLIFCLINTSQITNFFIDWSKSLNLKKNNNKIKPKK